MSKTNASHDEKDVRCNEAYEIVVTVQNEVVPDLCKYY